MAYINISINEYLERIVLYIRLKNRLVEVLASSGRALVKTKTSISRSSSSVITAG
jgi:hypothetical protein